MSNSYFIGAKNVCILFHPQYSIHIKNFINHCDEIFGWASQYYKKRGTNKIYVVFPTLIRGQDYFQNIENNNIILEFPNNVFIDNLPHPVVIKGYIGHNDQVLHQFLPSIENNHFFHQRISNLEYQNNSNINNLHNNLFIFYIFTEIK